MRHSIVAVLFLSFLCAGCKEQTGPDGRVLKPRKGEKFCFECAGKGNVSCGAGGCQSGQAECPGPCLKLSRGKWEHMEVAGHAPSELWQKFSKADGGYLAWNHHHVGEVIQTDDGMPRNIGKCPTCSGTTKIQCAKCLGKGAQPCFVCEGKAVVPKAWTSADNPRLNNHPDLIRLRDGRRVIGRIAMQAGSSCTIRTRDGKMIEVSSADILSKPAVR
jgi:hypothetical protein